MTDVRAVTDHFAVAGQVRPEDMADLAGRFTAVVNNRPDGEEPGQPDHARMREAAEAAGLSYRWIPVTGVPGPHQVQAMAEALDAAGGPTLAFCRTGTRSIVTWALVQAIAGRPLETLTIEGAAAGYDLGPPLAALLPRLRT